MVVDLVWYGMVYGMVFIHSTFNIYQVDDLGNTCTQIIQVARLAEICTMSCQITRKTCYFTADIVTVIFYSGYRYCNTYFEVSAHVTNQNFVTWSYIRTPAQLCHSFMQFLFVHLYRRIYILLAFISTFV